MELKVSSQNVLNCVNLFLLQLVSFTVDGDPLEPTGGVDRNASHVIFVMHLAHVITLTSWLKVSQMRSHSIHMPSMMLHV